MTDTEKPLIKKDKEVVRSVEDALYSSLRTIESALNQLNNPETTAETKRGLEFVAADNLSRAFGLREIRGYEPASDKRFGEIRLKYMDYIALEKSG